MAEGVRLADRLEAEPEGTPFCSQISLPRQAESSARKRRWRLLFRLVKCQPSDGSRSLSNGARGFQAIKIFFLVGFEMQWMAHNPGRLGEGDLQRLRDDLRRHICRTDERGEVQRFTWAGKRTYDQCRA